VKAVEDATVREPAMSAELSQEKIDAINEALFAGKFIEAIKIYRTATSSGLKEAKDFIEALEARLRTEMPQRFTAPQRKPVTLGAAGCVLMVGLIAAALGTLALLIK
jgi:ribosomal protein L7/L12